MEVANEKARSLELIRRGTGKAQKGECDVTDGLCKFFAEEEMPEVSPKCQLKSSMVGAKSSM